MRILDLDEEIITQLSNLLFYLFGFAASWAVLYSLHSRLQAPKNLWTEELRRRRQHREDSRPLPPCKSRICSWIHSHPASPNGPIATVYDPVKNIESRLLSIPTELRFEIYSHILADSRIHCLPIKKRVGRFVCDSPEAAKCNCHAKPFELWRTAKGLPPNVKQPQLQLLRTCRQVYVEATPLFYSRNTFVLHSIWNIVDVPAVVRPWRLAQIRKLSLVFNFGAHGLMPFMSPISRNPIHAPATDDTWSNALEVLGREYTGVKELSIWLEMRSLDLFLEQPLQKWTEPLLQVRNMRLKECTVRLTGWDDRFRTRKAEIPQLEKEIECMLLEPP